MPGHNSRSRSRSPVKASSTCNGSASASHGSQFRERSLERSSHGFEKSDVYKRDNLTLQDVPLSNSSYYNRIRSPEHKQEQESRGRSREHDNDDNGGDRAQSEEVADTNEEDGDDMISLMGFNGFGSTKGKHVKGTKGGKVRLEKTSDYRQYINRPKGFNRPLSPSRK